MTSKDLAATDDASQELIKQSDAALEAIAAQQAQEYDDDTVSTPILKVCQALSQEVQDDEAEPGEFRDTLAAESLGDTVEVIPCYYNKGRFASDQDSERAYVAFSSDIPAHWVDLVGEQFVGSAFAEYPDAEETFKKEVNEKKREWGHGPLISTTHNFTCLIVAEGEDGETEYRPVRLSLKRTDVPAAKKINTLHRMQLRNKPPWDAVLTLSTTKKAFGKNSAFVINPTQVKIVRPTTPTEKALAAELALAVAGGRTVSEGDVEDKAVEPKAEGALAV